jgi:hypothetical protein
MMPQTCNSNTKAYFQRTGNGWRYCVDVNIKHASWKRHKAKNDAIIEYEFHTHCRNNNVNVVLITIINCEVLGAVPVLYPSRWNWSFHLFLGRPMLLFPFGLYLYFSACLCILSVPILSTCCRHSRWYCRISRTMLCTPSFSLADWFLSLSN